MFACEDNSALLNEFSFIKLEWIDLRIWEHLGEKLENSVYAVKGFMGMEVGEKGNQWKLLDFSLASIFHSAIKDFTCKCQSEEKGLGWWSLCKYVTSKWG